jgi:potassium-transporting ATPase potassium-binding subunit
VTHWAEAAFLFLVVVLCVRPLGTYMARVFEGEATPLTPLLAPIETGFYRLLRIRPGADMTWQTYVFTMLAVSLTGIAAHYLLLRTQYWLPLNPQHFGNVAPDLAWNVAVGFATTADWQAYSGENTLGYLAQMAGGAWHNFHASAIGLAIGVAFIRGFSRHRAGGIGNFWVDLTRAYLYVLLPISVLGAVLFVWQGVPQNFHPYLGVVPLEGGSQTITGGPMASQEVIKLLGGNGGGFVNANSASPNENPTPFSDLLQLFWCLLIPAALTYTFGRMVRDRRQGWAVFAAMSVLFWGGVAGSLAAEAPGNPAIHRLGVAGPNLEGKEVRFGAGGGALSAVVTTDAATGSIDGTFDSLLPLTGLVALADMETSEVAFGGVGSGLYGMLTLAIVAVFVAGLMVGRTPEYLGKKIGSREIQLAMLAVLAFPLAILVPTAVAALLPAGAGAVGNAGPHGFTEMLFAFTSVTGGNGGAFAGLNANNLFYNLVLGVSMFIGRFCVAVPTLALAGGFAAQPANRLPGFGSLNTATPLFVVFLIGIVVFVGALTFFPADALGPIVEQVLMRAGKTF